jgi:hypothetical protein
MNGFCERSEKISVRPLRSTTRAMQARRSRRLCESASNLVNLLLHRVGIIATATALVLLILIPSAGGQELQRLSLDSASLLGTMVSTDLMVKKEGKGSIKISTPGPTNICLGVVQSLNVENARLVYQGRVKSENLEGAAFLEMWCEVGGGSYFSRGMNSTVTGTMDWQILQTPFFLQAGQKANRVTLHIIINGRGTVWVDDVVLFKKPLH